MDTKTNYGKIIAITLAVIASASSIAFIIYRLCRNLISFCNSYTVPEEDELCDVDLCELDECDDECDEEEEDEPAEEIVVEGPEATA